MKKILFFIFCFLFIPLLANAQDTSINFNKINFSDSNYLSTFGLTEDDVNNVYDYTKTLGSKCNHYFFYPAKNLYNGSSWGKGFRLICSDVSTLGFSLKYYSSSTYTFNLLLKGSHIYEHIYMNKSFYKGSSTIQDVTYEEFSKFYSDYFDVSSLNFYFYSNYDSILFTDLFGSYNQFIINDNIYDINDSFVFDNSDISIPKITYEKTFEEVDSLDKIVSQSFKFSWDIFDTSKYDYYISYDNLIWGVINSKDSSLTFIDNGVVYFKVTNKNDDESLYTFSYEVNDINNYLSEDSLNEDNYFFGDLTDNPAPDDVPNETDSTVSGYIQWWVDKLKNLIFEKFGIFEQFRKIYSTYKTYNISGWGESGFIYQFSNKKTFLSCELGSDSNNNKQLKCFYLEKNTLPFINEGIYLIDLSNLNNLISFLHILVYIFLGSFTALKCYRLIISFIDKFKIGGV